MTQRFVHAKRARGPAFGKSNCCVGDCGSSGVWRWYILDHHAGRVCGKHKAEFVRVWERETDRA